MYKKQKGLCWICSERMAISPQSAGGPRYATFDHIVPKSEGGVNAQSNLMLAHKRCNVARASLPLASVLITQLAAVTEEPALEK